MEEGEVISLRSSTLADDGLHGRGLACLQGRASPGFVATGGAACFRDRRRKQGGVRGNHCSKERAVSVEEEEGRVGNGSGMRLVFSSMANLPPSSFELPVGSCRRARPPPMPSATSSVKACMMLLKGLSNGRFYTRCYVFGPVSKHCDPAFMHKKHSTRSSA